jgi:radical SAM superfamily enzyme YgiQ (UPF0313 family)
MFPCFGHFGETDDTIRQTMDYVTKLDSDSIHIQPATPYPGTRFYDDVIRRDLLIAKNGMNLIRPTIPLSGLPGLSTSYLKISNQKHTDTG